MKRYVIIGNDNEWCKAAWEGELKENKSITFFSESIPFTGNSLLKLICELHYSKKINSRFKIPFKRVWYHNFLKTLDINNNDEYIFIIYDWSRLSFDFSFLEYLRKKCRKVKIVYMFTNVVRITGAKYYNILHKLTSYYDVVYAFDKLDADRYGFLYSPLIYTRSDYGNKVEITSDLFYVGQAKDRYNHLIEIFEIAKKNGLRCDFHIVGVPENEQKYKDEIVYNQPMTYEEVIQHIKSASCLVDATQGNSSGFTIKVCEAVIFDKKLISTNPFIREAVFYNDEKILTFPFDNDANIKDFVQGDSVFYNKMDKDVFSPSTLFRKIEKDVER